MKKVTFFSAESPHKEHHQQKYQRLRGGQLTRFRRLVELHKQMVRAVTGWLHKRVERRILEDFRSLRERKKEQSFG